MAVTFSVSFSDPSGLNHTGFYDDLTRTVLGAANQWSRYLIGDASLEILVTFADSNGSHRAGGSSPLTTGTGEVFDGKTVLWHAPWQELVTGVDPNGAAADINLFIAPRNVDMGGGMPAGYGYLEDELWFDPNPATRAMAVGDDKTDAVSVWLHEIGHALGMFGYRSWAAPYGIAGSYATQFDTQIVVISNKPYFNGEKSSDFNGDSLVPLTEGNVFHYGNSVAMPGADPLNGLMNGKVFYRETRYEIGALDIYILDDLGLPMVDVWGTDGANSIASGAAGDWMRAFAGNDTLAGGNGNDTLEAMSGSDSLHGGGGNDVLYGGTGSDKLRGSAGADLYVFDSALNASSNKDTILDFAAGDKIVLDNDIFKRLGAPALKLAAGKFSADGVAHDANDFILYNPATGALSYDRDGNGTAYGAVQFAVLSNTPDLTAARLQVID